MKATRTFEAHEFATAHEAIQYADASGGEPILLSCRRFVVNRRTFDRLDNARVSFARLCDHEMHDGSHRIMTIPCN